MCVTKHVIWFCIFQRNNFPSFQGFLFNSFSSSIFSTIRWWRRNISSLIPGTGKPFYSSLLLIISFFFDLSSLPFSMLFLCLSWWSLHLSYFHHFSTALTEICSGDVVSHNNDEVIITVHLYFIKYELLHISIQMYMLNWAKCEYVYCIRRQK